MGMVVFICAFRGECMYINQKQYKKQGGKYAGDDLAGLIERACGLIDHLTHGRIAAAGFTSLTKHQQAAVQKSAILMVDYFATNDADVAAYTMGDMSVSRRSTRQKPWELAGCGLWAWTTLQSTGLMRGVLI